MRNTVCSLLAATFLLLPTNSQAQPDKSIAVVMSFTGKGGSLARNQVLRGARTSVDLERKKKADTIKRRKRLNLRHPAHRMRLARAMDVDFIVWGSVRGRGNTGRTTLRIADRTGKQVSSRRMSAPGTSKRNRDIRRKTKAALLSAMEASGFKPAVEDYDDDSNKDYDDDSNKDYDDDSNKDYDDDSNKDYDDDSNKDYDDDSNKDYDDDSNKDYDDDSNEDYDDDSNIEESSESHRIQRLDHDSEVDESDEESKGRSEMRAANRDAVATIMVGMGGRKRNATLNTLPSGKRKYESGLFSELLFHARFFPGAKSEKKGMRGLYAQLDGAFGLVLSSMPQGTGPKLGTKTYRLAGHFGYLHPFDSAKFGVIGGVGLDEFKIDDNAVLPSARYIYGRIGLVGQYSFIDQKLYCRLDMGFRYPFVLGDMDIFGSSSKGIGYDAGLSLGGQVDVVFTWMARFGWERYALNFSGLVSTTADAAGTGKDGTDDNLLFQALAGWSF